MKVNNEQTNYSQPRILAPKRKRVESGAPAINPKRRRVEPEILSSSGPFMTMETAEEKKAKPHVLTSPAKATAVSSTPAPPPLKGYRPWVIAPKQIRVEYGAPAPNPKRRRVEPEVLSGPGLSMTTETTEKKRAKPRVLTSPAKGTAVSSTPLPPPPKRNQPGVIALKRKRVETEEPAPDPKRRQVAPEILSGEKRAKRRVLTSPAKGTNVSSTPAPPLLKGYRPWVFAPKRIRVEYGAPAPNLKRRQVEPEILSGSGLSMTMETTEKKRDKPRVLTSPAEGTAISSTPAPALPSRRDQTRIIASKRKQVEIEEPAPNPKRRQVGADKVSGPRPAMTKEDNKAKPSDLAPPAKGTAVSSTPVLPLPKGNQSRVIAPKRKRVGTEQSNPDLQRRRVGADKLSGPRPAMTKEENKATPSDLTPPGKGTVILSTAAPAPPLRRDQTRAIAPKQKRVETKEAIPPPKRKRVEPETSSGQKITAPKCKRGETEDPATSSRKTTAKRRRARTGVERFIFSL